MSSVVPGMWKQNIGQFGMEYNRYKWCLVRDLLTTFAKYLVAVALIMQFFICNNSAYTAKQVFKFLMLAVWIK